MANSTAAVRTNQIPRPKPAAELTAAGLEKQPSKIARQIYASVRARLESEFESFVESSAIEEKRLLIEILNDHMNRSGNIPRHPGEYEVALHSAIQRQLDGCACVVVPNDDMVPKVEEFISALEKKHWKRAPYDPSHRETADETRDRLAKGFRAEFELFARDAGQPSLSLMRAILARWNELANDPELKGFPNTLAVAAQIELDRHNADTTAEKSKAA